MTRKGSRQSDWTTDDIAYLLDTAGRLSLRVICRELKRSSMSVKKMAARLNLSLRCYQTKLVWCNECAQWRSYINKSTGKCKVCSMRDQLQGREAACVDVYQSMTAEQRLVYDENESKRGTRKYPARPQKRESCPMSMYERAKAEADYRLAIEAWEYQRVKLPYDATKTRLRRMREVIGANPRKKSK